MSKQSFKTTPSGLNYDSNGFIVHQLNSVEKPLTEIYDKLAEIYQVLIDQQYGNGSNSSKQEEKDSSAPLSRFNLELKRASNGVQDFVSEVGKTTQDLKEKDKNNKINSSSTGTAPTTKTNRTTAHSSLNGTNSQSQTQAIERVPVVTQSPIPYSPPLATPVPQQSNTSTSIDSTGRERDAKGRFTGKKEEPKSNQQEAKKFLNEAVKSFKSGLKGVAPDAQGVDPTLDAIKELGTVLQPVKKASEFTLRPITAVVNWRKKNEPITKAQKAVNDEQTGLLRTIAKNSNNQMTPLGLARMLPMAGLALGGAVVTLLIPKLKTLLGLDDDSASTSSPDHVAPDDTVNASLGDLPFATGNARSIDYRHGTTGDGLQQIIGKPLHPYEPPNGFFGAGNTSMGGNNLSVHEKTKGLIRHYERYSKNPYYDVNAYRGGYASDTYTTADGKVHKVYKGQGVGKEDAERDLERRTNIYTNHAKRTVGAEAWDKLTDESKMVAVATAYNYGSLTGKGLKNYVSALKGGDKNKIANEVQLLGKHNNSARLTRMKEEANLIRKGSSTQSNTAIDQQPKQTMAQPLQIKPLVDTSTKMPQYTPSPLRPVEQIKSQVKTKVASVEAQAPKPSTVNNNQNVTVSNTAGLGDNISQNVGDRDIHHVNSGGIGNAYRYNG